MTPTAGTPTVTWVRTIAEVRPRRLTPFRRVDGEWVTNSRVMYVERLPKGSAKKSPSVSLLPRHGFAKLLTDDEVAAVRAWARKRGWVVRVTRKTFVIERFPNLDGDLDCNSDLLRRLQRVAERLSKREGRKVVVFVRSGTRTLAEQQVLWDRYGPPRAARPNPNAPHVRGIAADCGIDGRDIGDYPGAREAMRAEGLCLRVPGEDWHVEVGNTWAA